MLLENKSKGTFPPFFLCHQNRRKTNRRKGEARKGMFCDRDVRYTFFKTVSKNLKSLNNKNQKRMTCKIFLWNVLIEIWFSINNQMSQPGQVVEGTPLGSMIITPKNITNILTQHFLTRRKHKVCKKHKFCQN